MLNSYIDIAAALPIYGKMFATIVVPDMELVNGGSVHNQQPATIRSAGNLRVLHAWKRNGGSEKAMERSC